MKKVLLIVLMLFTVMIFGSCSTKETETPSIYINATYLKSEDGVDLLDFQIENRSNTEFLDLIYKAGNLYEYEIVNLATKEVLTGRSDMNEEFVLSKGSAYNEFVLLPELKSGEYNLFLGSSAEGVPRVGIETTFEVTD